MDFHCFWKVLFTLYLLNSMLGCDVDAIGLGSIPHDVTENKSSLNRSHADSTNNVSTCLTLERDGTLICNNITHGSTNNDSINPDLGYTYQVDHLGKVISICFNFTILELIGDSYYNVQLNVTITETNDSELNLVLASDTDEMRVYILFQTIYEPNGNIHRRYNETAVTLAGNFEKFRIGQKDARAFTLKQCDRKGNCIHLNENATIRHPDDTTIHYLVIIGALVVVNLLGAVIILILASGRRQANQQQQMEDVSVCNCCILNVRI
ncbi:uncharacterized protein LOC131934864 [Physella acuta]|uniref:uncharacterized protein LOC131934864 n=1 Tax=Physella acuta TaxID=109671 RepID=UPI0027DE54F9|nr:uncharacterized protein LOC131934864 [Physella acuta]